MSQIRQDPLQAMLYMLYRRENSAEDALRGIEETFGNGVTTLEQVQMFYRTFVSGEYTVMEPTEEKRITRMNMALMVPDVQKLLTGYLDFKSRLALRHTSRMFCEITTVLPIHIKELIITYREHYVEVKTDDGYKTLLMTRSRKKYLERPKAYKERIQKFYKMVTTDLMNVLKFESLTVDKMHTNRECHESRDLKNSFTTLRMHRAIVAALSGSLRAVHGDDNQKMHVERFSSNSEPLLSDIMPLLKPKTLRGLSIYHANCERGTTLMGGNPIMLTDQWKNLVDFYSSIPLVIYGSLANFTHCASVVMEVFYTLTQLDFVQLKADLLRKPNFVRFVVGTEKMSPNERDQLHERLGTRKGVWTQFVYPDNANLKMLIRVFKSCVWFKGPGRMEWTDDFDDEKEEDWGAEE